MSSNKGYYILLLIGSLSALMIHGYQYISTNSIKLTSGHMYSTDALLVVLFELVLVIISSVKLLRIRSKNKSLTSSYVSNNNKKF